MVADFRRFYQLQPAEILSLNFKIFMCYLNSLPEDASLSKIIQLRSMSELDIHDDKILELKRKFTLEQKEANTEILSIWASQLAKE
ncbi:Gp15 family bacteriophage protein [Mycoplasma sp. Z1473D]